MPWHSREVPTLIEDLCNDPACFWRRVEQALETDCTVGIRTPLLQRLVGPLGKEYKGQRWLMLKSRTHPRELLFVFRFRDIVLSAIALALVFPLLLLLGILIKVFSPGPVIFSSTVIGRRKRSFWWYKLRSMTVVPDDSVRSQARFAAYVRGESPTCILSAGQTKVIDLDRVTPVGKWLRRHSLDELPQLWNVMRGEMALVGPRPCLPYEASFYVGWRGRRFEIPPGITGVWQVFGRGMTSFDESVAMDVYYSLRKSFSFDFYLLARTVVEVFRGKGAV